MWLTKRIARDAVLLYIMFVIPAGAGIQSTINNQIPAFAGMTSEKELHLWHATFKT